MSAEPNLTSLPADLPVPEDDGAASHLVGAELPPVRLPDSRGRETALDAVRSPAVLYVFPMMGRPGTPLPEGWDETPGARGCTVQSLKYNDGLDELGRLGIEAFGISAQDPAEQREAAERLSLRQVLLSDCEGKLRDALGLPTFELHGRRYLRRLTMMVVDGRIERVWYPVFPPGEDVAEVQRWVSR